jgi:hypothetical protein
MEGMPGMSMYSKDEMMQQMEQYDEDYGSDEGRVCLLLSLHGGKE